MGYSSIFLQVSGNFSAMCWEWLPWIQEEVSLKPCCQTCGKPVSEALWKKHLQEVAVHVYEHGCGHDDDDENHDKHDYIVNWLWCQKTISAMVINVVIMIIVVMTMILMMVLIMMSLKIMTTMMMMMMMMMTTTMMMMTMTKMIMLVTMTMMIMMMF